MISNNANKNNLIQIKYELFDHLIYPLSCKLDDNSIIQLFRKLHIMSTIDYKISYKEWLDQAISNLTGLTEKEAKILFNSYKVFASDLEPSKSTTNQNSRYENYKQQDNVDVRYFGLFFSLQLFLQRSKQHSMETRTDKNPYTIYSNTFTSPLSSPRGKGSSSSRTLNSTALEFQMIINFVKSNIRLFLRLIASDIHNTETSLNSNEFNTLKFIFKLNITNKNDDNTGLTQISDKNILNIHDKSKRERSVHSMHNIHSSMYTNQNQNQPTQMASLAPFFLNFSTTTKINIDIITEWITTNLITANNVNTELEEFVYLKNLSKCVTIKESPVQNKNLKISQCEDSYIYINSNVMNVRIANCNNCTIVVAAVSKITSIDKCENCSICIATNLLRVSNTIDTVIYSYSICEPILFGDNRALVLAPHNVIYNELPGLLKSAKLDADSNYIYNFSRPILLHSSETEEKNYVLMPAKDFSQIVVPFINTSGNLILTPKEFIDVLKDRDVKVATLKTLISQSHLQNEQEKALHVAIQGYFREWLVSSGNIKPMTDIVKMIDLPTGTNRNNNGDISINNGNNLNEDN